jgi:aerobic carbon-monoxide dehydrogenase large subunit
MATTTQPAGRLVGASVRRREDPRFLTGRGRFTDDLKLPGMTYAAFVRSPHAHARINRIDATRALAQPGVRAVYTGEDLARTGVGNIPPAWLVPGIKVAQYAPLPTTKARFAGQAVAVVIADTLYAARDAADLVDVDYDVLPAVVDATAALSATTLVHDEIPENRCFVWSIGDKEKTDAAFRAAPHVVKQRLVNNRLSPVAIEPRAAIARLDQPTGEMTLWVTSQNPHVHRLIIGAFVLGIPEHKFRVIAGDVGGGFGSKIHIYPEECVVTWAARALGRPVKWTATRSESFLTDAHGRDHVTDAELALAPDGKILALRLTSTVNLGAHLSLFSVVTPTWLYGPVISGSYEIPTVHLEVTAAYTNTTPVDAVRGAGRPEACYALERIVDLAASRLGIDPAAIRRKNFVPPEKFPYPSASGVSYDSGNYAPALDLALEKVGYTTLRREQASLREQGRYIGIGLSSYIEACGVAPSRLVGQLGAQAGLWDSALVRVHPTGKVTIFTGSHAHGQGHETTFAQIAADALGIPLDDIDVVHGDTALIPMGMGTYGSRSGAVGGTAIHLSLQKIRDKAKKLAAHLLEAAEGDVEFEDGRLFVRGSPDRGKSFQEVTLAAYLAHNYPEGMEPGLEATTFFDPSNFTFPFGTHIAVVEVKRDTGEVRLDRYVAVDDVGNVINPMIVDGMVHGGVAHGIGQALWEHARYDDNGQLLTGSLLEYGVPKADQLVNFETDRTVTPTPVNPLGVKGVGEAGTIAAPPAIANAVLDALSPFGVTHIDIPLTPAKLWAAMQQGNGRV